MINCDKVNIKNGSVGTDVIELQNYLTYLGYYKELKDGVCGPVTVKAIKQLQKQYKVLVDGVFGSKTCKACGINGVDVSNSNLTLDNATIKDMIKRHEDFIYINKREPKTIFLDGKNKYQYVTNEKYKEILSRHTSYIEKNKREPNFAWINKPISTVEEKYLYTSKPHYTLEGCNYLGQCTKYYCAPHSIHQCVRKFGITKDSEKTYAGWCGTTTAGTGHGGINTCVQKIDDTSAANISIQWFNFSDFGSNIDARWKSIGELIERNDTAVFIHNKYRNEYGHYEAIQEINTKNKTIKVLNSLGNKCGSTSFCGYIETRSFNTFASYISKISQKSIAVIQKK